MSRGLFGTATQEEVDELRRMILQLNTNGQQVVHSTNRLTTLVNQHSGVLQEYGDKLNELVSTLNDIYSDVGRLSVGLKNISRQIDLNTILLHVEQVLSGLEKIFDVHHRREINHLQQRLSCEGTTFSEGLVDADYFNKLKDQMDYGDNQILDVFWYYGNVGVSKLMIDDEYVCQVNIPLTYIDEYDLYFIITVDTWCGDGKQVCRLDVPPQAAIESMTGQVLFPKQCYGNDPVICIIDVIETNTYDSCVQGLVANHYEDITKCIVQVSRTPHNKVTWIKNNEYLLLTNTTEYLYTCKSKALEKGYIGKGLVWINVKAGCMFESSTVQITGNELYTSVIEVIPEKDWMNFNMAYTAFLPVNVTLALGKDKLKDVQIQKFDNLDKIAWTAINMKRHNIFVYVSLVLAILLVITIVVMIGYWKYKRWRRRKKQRKEPKVLFTPTKEENEENEASEAIVEIMPEAAGTEAMEPKETEKMFTTFGYPNLYPKLP